MQWFTLLLLVCSLAFSYPEIPDENMTPGDLCTVSNPHFKEFRYEEQIPYCNRRVSSSKKRYIYEQYDIPEYERREYTIDHLIPLSIGGSNSDENLWPEHKEVKALRPQLEWEVYTAVREGDMTQDEAVEIVLEAKFCPSCVSTRTKCFGGNVSFGFQGTSP